jgi:HEAT repeat protein
MGFFGLPNVEKMKAKGNVEGLIKELGYQKDAKVRQAAARALGELGKNHRLILQTRVRDGLILALQDPKAEVRRAAAWSLEKINISTGEIEVLLAALRDGDPLVRKYSIDILGKFIHHSDPGLHLRLVETLIDSLKDKDSWCRESAARALGIPEEASAIEPLILALNDREERVGWAALAALRQIGVPAIQPLMALLWKSNAKIRNAAANTLREIGWTLGPDENGAMYWVITRRWEKCVEIGAAAIKPLISALEQENWEIRQRAAEALLAIFRSGHLDETQQRLILEQRSKISSDHADQNKWVSTGSSSDCTGNIVHTDNNGVGVSFQF